MLGCQPDKHATSKPLQPSCGTTSSPAVICLRRQYKPRKRMSILAQKIIKRRLRVQAWTYRPRDSCCHRIIRREYRTDSAVILYPERLCIREAAAQSERQCQHNERHGIIFVTRCSNPTNASYTVEQCAQSHHRQCAWRIHAGSSTRRRTRCRSPFNSEMRKSIGLTIDPEFIKA